MRCADIGCAPGDEVIIPEDGMVSGKDTKIVRNEDDWRRAKLYRDTDVAPPAFGDRFDDLASLFATEKV